MKLYAAGNTCSNALNDIALPSGKGPDAAGNGATVVADPVPIPDRIDSAVATSSGASQHVAVQIPDHPQGDVYASEGHAAIWQAYYLQKLDGFSTGRGPKTANQMAFIIKRQLQQDFDAAHVPIHFSAVAQPSGSKAAFLITGRDASASGIDVTLNRDGSTQMTPYEFGKPQRALQETYQWHPEKHDTGYLERLIRGLDRNVWVPDNTGNVMTGKDL